MDTFPSLLLYSFQELGNNDLFLIGIPLLSDRMKKNGGALPLFSFSSRESPCIDCECVLFQDLACATSVQLPKWSDA